jgi:hypothetical protein
MLDVSRGRVPNLATLLELAERMADFKLNELQLYVEHTFAYRNYEAVWRDWGALTGDEIMALDSRCRALGIELVPNQNSFGHLRYWLEHPALKHLAEISEPYEGSDGTFLRYPTTLAPTHPGTLPFLRELFDELLPCFTSERFNVGCDETWDLGRGQSREVCEQKGKARVYLDFLKQIHREVESRGKQMLFWGDIILNHPELLQELPENVVAMNWGYEADHPFEREAGLFAQSKVPFYVCPGTSTWMSLVGRNDNAFANLRAAGRAGTRNGAIGYLNTDWGDGGHPQPLPVSFPAYLVGAAVSWCGSTFHERSLAPVLSRDVFQDNTGKLAEAVLDLGIAHRKFDYLAPNITPFGAVLAAPPPAWRELVCRDGLKYYARISPKKIRAAAEELEVATRLVARSAPGDQSGQMMKQEVELAARMAAESCEFMLWQQALADGDPRKAAAMAKRGIKKLRALALDFENYWPNRNKGTTEKCAGFLRWRCEDYRSARLHFTPATARSGWKR